MSSKSIEKRRKKFEKIVSKSKPIILKAENFIDFPLVNFERIYEFVMSKENLKNKLLNIQKSKNENFSGTPKKSKSQEMPFKAFLNYFKSENPSKERLYLCQSNIISKNPNVEKSPLRKLKTLFPRPKIIKKKSFQSSNLWINRYKTITNLHFDDDQNLLLVLQGSKNVTLFEPNAFSPSISNHITTKSTSILSHSKSLHFSLNPGDILFIPEGWWHEVNSIEKTIAVNFWFDGLREKMSQIPSASLFYAKTALKITAEEEIERRRQNVKRKTTKRTLKGKKLLRETINLFRNGLEGDLDKLFSSLEVEKIVPLFVDLESGKEPFLYEILSRKVHEETLFFLSEKIQMLFDGREGSKISVKKKMKLMKILLRKKFKKLFNEKSENFNKNLINEIVRERLIIK